ncbi:THUMP domain-containing protein [Thermofilum pendens]|uniref:THUMP domain protein n=1 Tax=Thermofilum pendens (strain DSM 2475 / Hrk 5) TaxID=368408 RepID=A1RWP4_THEPD|nr:THUMP domain-containing protein [Thermofilum pendens]ABL77624.1 THUMP domain protein [Thermofilum pendens Hrk 5]
MLGEFNLVVSTYRQRENDCISELWFFAKELGDSRLDASKTGLPSLVVAKTSLDPEDFVAKAREKIEENPWYFRYILKITPIQVTVDADIQQIVEAALRLSSSRLNPGETFKVEAHIRLSELRREDIIREIASRITNKVNLDNPDKIVLVEVIGDRAGVSVIPPSMILSVERARREAKARKHQSERLDLES